MFDKKNLVISLLLVVVYSFSFVSAGLFGDFFGWMT